MAGSKRLAAAENMLDVRRAAALIGRHPETVRRWVWSGRLAARRQGNLLLIARADLEAVAGSGGSAPATLAEWADRARTARDAARADGSGRSAADLVIEDRSHRSRAVDPRAGR